MCPLELVIWVTPHVRMCPLELVIWVTPHGVPRRQVSASPALPGRGIPGQPPHHRHFTASRPVLISRHCARSPAFYHLASIYQFWPTNPD
jgi:hypothetical protein